MTLRDFGPGGTHGTYGAILTGCLIAAAILLVHLFIWVLYE